MLHRTVPVWSVSISRVPGEECTYLQVAHGEAMLLHIGTVVKVTTALHLHVPTHQLWQNNTLLTHTYTSLFPSYKYIYKFLTIFPRLSLFFSIVHTFLPLSFLPTSIKFLSNNSMLILALLYTLLLLILPCSCYHHEHMQ